MTTVCFSRNNLFQEELKIKTKADALPPFILNRGRLYQRIKQVGCAWVYDERSFLVIE